MVLHRLRLFGLTLPAALLVVGGLGIVRLGRQFPAAAASPGLLVPFLLPVLALGLEAAAFVALSVAQLGALAAPGASSWTWLRRARETSPQLLLLALVLGVAELIPRGTEDPGAFANRLVETARESCARTLDFVPIPLLGLAVRCGEHQRIEGPMPGVRGSTVVMRELHFSSDLKSVDISGLELTAARSLTVHLSAESARVSGLAPWSRSPRLSAAQRFLVLGALGFAWWLAASFGFRLLDRPPPISALRAPPRWSRLLLTCLLAVPGAILAAGFVSLDQDRAAPPAYAWALGAALLALGALTFLVRRLPWIANNLNSL